MRRRRAGAPSAAAPRLALALVWVVLGLLVPQPRGVAAAAPLRVVSDTATADFPIRMSFSLTAEASQEVTAAELRYHAAYAPITDVVRATLVPGREVSPSVKVEMQTHYLPPGVDVLYHWRLTLADGTSADTPERTLFYMDNRRSWAQLSAGQVTVYYDTGSSRFGQQMLDTATQAIDQLKARFHVTADQPVRIVVYGSNKDLLDALPPNSAEWIGGFTQPELHIVVTGIPAGDTGEVNRILSHESVHLILHQATDNPWNEPPPWLDEGLATYYQFVQDARLPAALATAVRNGQLIPVPALDASFPDDANRALLSYAESRSVAQFIVETKGERAMAALIATFVEGVSYEQAVEQGLGETEVDLDREWKAWLGYAGDRPNSSALAPAGHAARANASLTAREPRSDVGVLVLVVATGGAGVARRRRERAAG